MTFTLATENTRKCYQAPFPIFRTGPGNEATSYMLGGSQNGLSKHPQPSNMLYARQSRLSKIPQAFKRLFSRHIGLSKLLQAFYTLGGGQNGLSELLQASYIWRTTVHHDKSLALIPGKG